MQTHDLDQQSIYLRAALEQDKKPVGFLIGAGAPMSVRVDGKPVVPGMKELSEFVKNDVDEAVRGDISTLTSHLPPADASNLESLLGYVRSLAALPGDSDIRGISVEKLAKMDREICRVIRLHVDAELPDNDNAYTSLALWVSAVTRLVPTHLFTTNYDLLLEQALERQKVTYFDGFTGSREPRFDLQAIEEDQLPPRWSLLWKLHGSINWSHDSKGNVVRQRVDADSNSSALVYPSHLKYDQSRRLPHLAMLDRLRAFLRRPGAILIVTGFSFRDQHINEVLDQALRANPTATVQGLLHEDLDTYAEAIDLARRVPNLVLFARDKGAVGSVIASWSPATDPDSGLEIPTTSNIGDFGVLGEMLRTITGSRMRRVNDGE